jgi:SAM-dependent methyltransferase
MMQASEPGQLIICAHSADRDLIRDIDPRASLIATEQAADFYGGNQSEAGLTELFHRRSRQVIKLLDRFLFVAPLSLTEENALFAGFFEHISGEYEDLIDRACNLHNMDVLVSLLTSRLGNLQDLHILDFGCGTGLSLIPLTAVGANVTGLDQSVGMRKIAKARGMQVVTVEELERWPNQFDGIIASYVFHLYPDIRTIETVCRKLKVGGLIVGNFHKGIGLDYMVELFRRFDCEAFLCETTGEMERHGKYLAFIKG